MYYIYIRIFGVELSPVWGCTWTKMINECAKKNKNIIKKVAHFIYGFFLESVSSWFGLSYCSGIPVLQSEVKFEISSSGSINRNQFIMSFFGGTFVFRDEIW